MGPTMARTSIASFRAATSKFDWTYARVLSRAHLMNPQNADWVKVREWFSRANLKRISALADDEEGD